MKNIEEINKANVKKILAKKKIPEFFAGDTIKVGVRIVEGKRERIQYFEGVCIAKKNRDINSAFTVRKISFGEGVERTFALHSSIIDSIKIIRSGKTRRAKLYYLRDRKGKSARIAEKIAKKIGIDISENVSENQLADKNVIAENQTKTELKKETSSTVVLKSETNKKEPKKENLKKKELKKEKK
jgi:large subunit ribosomal protein L19|tara:strand:+ start:25 stop:579 length:555 start_codon:yes stop_codon:yes gene_type:complete